MEKYIINNVLAKLSYCSIYSICDSSNNKLCMIKFLKSVTDSKTKFELLNKQMQACPLSTISVKDIVLKDDSYVIIAELFESNLSLMIQENKLKKSDIPEIMFNLLSNLRLIHEERKTHGFFSPVNCLKTSSGYKIGFFEGSQIFKEEKERNLQVYSSPEVLLGLAENDDHNDIWALGCIMAEMYLGSPIFSAADKKSTLAKIVYTIGTPEAGEWDSGLKMLNLELGKLKPYVSKLEVMLKDIPPLAMTLLVQMLQWDPLMRPSAAILLQNSYFESLRKNTKKSFRVGKKGMSMTPKSKVLTLPSMKQVPNNSLGGSISLTPKLASSNKIKSNKNIAKIGISKFCSFNDPELERKLMEVKGNIVRLFSERNVKVHSNKNKKAEKANQFEFKIIDKVSSDSEDSDRDMQELKLPVIVNKSKK